MLNRMPDRPLVLVNALKLHEGALRSPAGNFQHVYNLAGELARLQDVAVHFLTDSDSYGPFSDRVSESQLIRTQLRGNSIVAADLAVRRAVYDMRPAIYHRPTGQLPFFPLPCLKVAGIADLNFKTLPCPILKRLYKEISYRWTVRHADRVVCVSRYTQSDVMKRLHCPPEKLRVVYHGANKLRPADAAIFERVPAKYWLAFAHQNHKNAELCLRALVEHRRLAPATALVLIGQNNYVESKLKPMAQALGLGDAVVFVGVVTSAELSALYQRALGLLFPSRFEGFGLPVIEAMRAGCPVICSTACSLPEVAGDAAVMIAPDDLAGMVAAMQNVVANEMFRKNLIAAGLKQAGSFTWERAAQETAAIYRELLPCRLAG